MPFTPLHFGPGLLLKAALGDRFSFFAYAGAQVCIDTEPLSLMLRGSFPLHRTLHTLAGAFCVSLVFGIAAPWLFRLGSRGAPRLFIPRLQPGWAVAVTSALAGGALHVFMDACLYFEMQPFWPLTQDNPFLGALNNTQMALLCLVTGILGGMLLLLRRNSISPNSS